MTILKAEAHGCLFVNGKLVLEVPKMEIHKAISQMNRHIGGLDMKSRDLSSIEIKFNKRPMTNGEIDKDLQELITTAGEDLVIVNEDDLVPGLPIEVTWGEWESLYECPIWKNAHRLAHERDRSIYTGEEMDSIKDSFNIKYQNTKYHMILWEKLLRNNYNAV